MEDLTPYTSTLKATTPASNSSVNDTLIQTNATMLTTFAITTQNLILSTTIEDILEEEVPSGHIQSFVFLFLALIIAVLLALLACIRWEARIREEIKTKMSAQHAKREILDKLEAEQIKQNLRQPVPVEIELKTPTETNARSSMSPHQTSANWAAGVGGRDSISSPVILVSEQPKAVAPTVRFSSAIPEPAMPNILSITEFTQDTRIPPKLHDSSSEDDGDDAATTSSTTTSSDDDSHDADLGSWTHGDQSFSPSRMHGPAYEVPDDPFYKSEELMRC